MKSENFRCDCPITSAVDVVGDKWSLVIIKQMLIENKKTFKDFTESDEAIASNILSSRLKMLESLKLIRKEKLPTNKKTNIYLLTDTGIGLAPVIAAMAIWSYETLGTFHPTMAIDDRADLLFKDKDKFVEQITNNYKLMVAKLHMA